MHLHLMFADVDIHGEGTDYVGPWKITGKINPQSKECQWIKHYLGKHQVRYCGIFGDDGIAGEWDIAKISRGKFHIWPAEMTEIQARYLAEEAANEQRPERT